MGVNTKRRNLRRCRRDSMSQGRMERYLDVVGALLDKYDVKWFTVMFLDPIKKPVPVKRSTCNRR